MWPFHRSQSQSSEHPPANSTKPDKTQPSNHSITPQTNYNWPFSVRDERVMQALAKVPRHRFIPSEQQQHANENRALPISHNQTISQPYIVALMTDLLQIKPHNRILEVGTGSGYQTAILAELSNHIYTTEIIPQLSHQAQKTLQSLNYKNIHFHITDGSLGWQKHAPYDAIIVTCTSPQLPQPLWDQLASPHGRLVIPIGKTKNDQQLILYKKTNQNTPTPEQICPVRFVPMTHTHH